MVYLAALNGKGIKGMFFLPDPKASQYYVLVCKKTAELNSNIYECPSSYPSFTGVYDLKHKNSVCSIDVLSKSYSCAGLRMIFGLVILHCTKEEPKRKGLFSINFSYD
jgi:hypothetical protein